ncbi:MAG: hypothetical protein AAGD07_21945 [Planctomycetota bacterium]
MTDWDDDLAESDYDTHAFDDEDYDEFIEREFGKGTSSSLSPIWKWTAWGLVLAILLPFVAALLGILG